MMPPSFGRRLARPLALGLLWIGLSAAHAEGQSFTVADKDLAVVLPTDDSSLRLTASDVGFSTNWLGSISDAFSETSVGRALDIENQTSDWQLVAMRVDPCQSLIPRPHTLSGTLCWPEVRLILQPIVRNVRALARIIPFYADDRAIHVLFDFRAQDLSSQKEWLTDALKTIDAGGSLDTAELERFLQVRNQAVQQILTAVRSLRDESLPSISYEGLELRPEAALSESRREAFRTRLQNFLSNVRSASGLPKEITAFSLPEGREPAHIDEWVFLQFTPVNPSQLRQRIITIKSTKSPETLVEIGPAERVTMARDAEPIYLALENLQGTPQGRELEDNLILFIPDFRRNADRIADDRVVRVANTSCASCHKLNADRFDFHNLSYLGERPITISPRVVRDVEINLEWLSRFDP
jgi:hypothetical protein